MQDISPPKCLHSVSNIVTHRSIFVMSLPTAHCTNSAWFYVTSLIHLLCVTFPNTFLVTRSQCHQQTRHCWPEVTHVTQTLFPVPLSAFYLLSLAKWRGGVLPAMTEANTGNKNKHYRAIQTYLYPNGTKAKGTPHV